MYLQNPRDFQGAIVTWNDDGAMAPSTFDSKTWTTASAVVTPPGSPRRDVYVLYIWRFVKMSVPGFVDKSQFHACRLMFAFKKHDLPWWRENVEILRYLWKSF